MATGGSSIVETDYASGQNYNVKRFGYAVLRVTLSKCGFPETHMRVRFNNEINPLDPNEVLTVYSKVIDTALTSRDKWKSIFETKKMAFAQNEDEEIEEFLAFVAFSMKPDKYTTDNKIRRSLAFFSELILFLHFKNIPFIFENLLDKWCKFFVEKCARDEDPDTVLESLLFEDPLVADYIRMVDCFLQQVAIPYDRMGNVSEIFQKFSVELQKFTASEPISSVWQRMRRLLLTRDLIDRIVGNMPPVNRYGTIPEEAVCYLSEVFQNDLVLPDNLENPEPPQC